MNKTPAQPNLINVIQEACDQVMTDINCHKVGIIESFDKVNQTVTVKLTCKRLVDEDVNGNKRWWEYPLLVDVPVIILSGGLGSIQFPITKGDECLVLFNDRNIDNWFVSGQISQLNNMRKHDLSDGICLVGVRSLVRSITGYLDDAVKINYDSNSIILDSDNIQLSSSKYIMMDAVDDITITTNKTVSIEAETILLNANIGATSNTFNFAGSLQADELHADNGLTGTYTRVRYQDGIAVEGIS